MQGLPQSSLGVCSGVYGSAFENVLWPDSGCREHLDASVSQLAARVSSRSCNWYRRSLCDAFHGVSLFGDPFCIPHQLHPQLCDQRFIGLSPKRNLLLSQAQQSRATGWKEKGFQTKLRFQFLFHVKFRSRTCHVLELMFNVLKPFWLDIYG